MEVTNADSTVQFTLTDLAAMQFSTDGEELLNGIDIVLSEDAPVTVYAITGMVVGSFTDGGFYTEGAYKATVELNNLTLTNVSGGSSVTLSNYSSSGGGFGWYPPSRQTLSRSRLSVGHQ